MAGRERVRVEQIGRKNDAFWLMCEDGIVRRFDHDDEGLYMNVSEWANSNNEEKTMDDQTESKTEGLTTEQCFERAAEALDAGNLNAAEQWRKLGESIDAARR